MFPLSALRRGMLFAIPQFPEIKSPQLSRPPVEILCSVNSNLGLFGQLKSIVDFNAKVADS